MTNDGDIDELSLVIDGVNYAIVARSYTP
jgi:hypothetical protein